MKQEEINGLSLEDLKERLDQQAEQLVKLKGAHAISPLENPLQIRYTRRTVSRLKTELTKRNKEALNKATKK